VEKLDKRQIKMGMELFLAEQIINKPKKWEHRSPRDTNFSSNLRDELLNREIFMHFRKKKY
jgi:hypothetical protein